MEDCSRSMLYKNLTTSPTASLQNHVVPGLEEKIEMNRQRSVLHGTVCRLTKTALHQAVVDERYRQVKLLVTNGSDVNAKDANGWTPLMLTCLAEREITRITMMKRFLKHGAKLNTQDNMGRTCLMIACMMNRTDLVSTLLSEEDTEILTQDKDGNTALMHAAKCSENMLLSLILNKMVSFGIDVDMRNQLGYTALLLACKSGNYQHALVLIRKGQACPYLRDHEFKFSAKDWLLRYEAEKRHRLLRTQEFPHLLKIRSHTEFPRISEYKKFGLMIDRLYAAKYKARADNPTCSIRTRLSHPEATSLDTISQEVTEKMLKELLRLITRAEETTDSSHNKNPRFRHIRQLNNRKREISTAVLRSITPRNKYSQQATIHTLFQLYARNYQATSQTRHPVALVH